LKNYLKPCVYVVEHDIFDEISADPVNENNGRMVSLGNWLSSTLHPLDNLPRLSKM
jgi:hypothetical protein